MQQNVCDAQTHKSIYPSLTSIALVWFSKSDSFSPGQWMQAKAALCRFTAVTRMTQI